MRVVIFVKATDDSEAGVMGTSALLEAMGRYNEELVDAGIMLAGDGLKPSKVGKRIGFDGPNRIVMDGPFSETKELVAGYWVWEVRDMDHGRDHDADSRGSAWPRRRQDRRAVVLTLAPCGRGWFRPRSAEETG